MISGRQVESGRFRGVASCEGKWDVREWWGFLRRPDRASDPRAAGFDSGGHSGGE